jgi:subtilisin family serine protease
VAPRATLVDVRVLDCDGLGTVSDVIAGLEYVAREHPRSKMAGVVTLSLGLSAGASSRALEQVRGLRSTRRRFLSLGTRE